MKRILAVSLMLLAVAAPLMAQDAPAPKFPQVKIMIVVPEFHRQQYGMLDQNLMSTVSWVETGYNAANPAAETELIKQFVDANYKVIDQNQYAAQRYTPDMEEVVKDPTGPKARSLTTLEGADILIVGKMSSELAGKVANTNSVRASLTLRAVCTKGDALIIGATDATGSGADIGEDAASLIASRKASDLAAAYMLQKVGNFVGGPTSNDFITAQAAKASAAGGKPRIAVMPFEDKSQWSMANWDLGMQIPDLIANELMKLGCYEIVDRSNLNQVVKQQGLQQSGLFDSGGQAEELGTLAKADYGVFGRISEFATKKKGAVLGIAGFGAALGAEEAKVNILIKIVDLKTGIVLATNEAPGDATAAVLGGTGYTDIVFGAGQFDNTAAGRATRKAIACAVKAVTAALPALCPACGAKIACSDKFCPNCGAAVNAAPAVCSKCKQPLKPGAKFCPNCGQKVGQ